MRSTPYLKNLPTFIKVGMFKTPSKTAPYVYSRTNMLVNLSITSLYGISLWTFYKDYMTTKRAAAHRTAEGKERPAFLSDIKKDVHDAPNRLFHSNKENEQVERGNFWRTFHSLTYGDVSMFCLGWGFIIQICNVGLTTQGRRSPVFRGGLIGALAFPPLAYYVARERLHKMEYEGVQIS